LVFSIVCIYKFYHLAILFAKKLNEKYHGNIPQNILRLIINNN